MAVNLILSPGMEGTFELAPPFTNKINAQTRYTIRSVTALSAKIAAGENPQDLYTAAGATEAQYLKDLQDDVYVISLQASSGDWVYVPQSFITSLPNVGGYSYRPLAITVPIGPTEDTKDLNNLLAAIDKLVLEHLGVASKSVVVAIAPAELVNQAEHDRIVTRRAAAVTYSESEAARAVRLTRENTELREQNVMLTELIRAQS